MKTKYGWSFESFNSVISEESFDKEYSELTQGIESIKLIERSFNSYFIQNLSESKSQEGIGQLAKDAIAFIKEKLIKLKNFVISIFKKFINFIKSIINRIFKKDKKVSSVTASVANSETIQKKNEEINKYNQNKPEDKKKENLDTQTTTILLQYTLEGISDKFSACISLDEIKRHSFYGNSKSIIKFVKTEELTRLVKFSFDSIESYIDGMESKISEMKTISPEYEGSGLNICVNHIQNIKNKCYTGDISDRSIITEFQYFANNIPDIHFLEGILKFADEYSTKYDTIISKVISKIDKNKEGDNNTKDKYEKIYKILTLQNATISNYVSGTIKLVMCINRAIEFENQILNTVAGIDLSGFGNIKISKGSFEEYAINIGEITLNSDLFKDKNDFEELKRCAKYLKEKICGDEPANMTTDEKSQEISKNVLVLLNLMVKYNTKARLIIGKSLQTKENDLLVNGGLTLYNFSIPDDGSSSGRVIITGKIIVDTRKRIDINQINCLYHVTESDKEIKDDKLLPSQGSSGGMGDVPESGIVYSGKKSRIYAAIYPCFKNGIPLNELGICTHLYVTGHVQTLKFFGYDDESIMNDQLIESFFNDYKIYQIDKNELLNKEIYADPEHNGIFQRIANTGMKDNCVYIETSEPIKAKLIDIRKFIDINKLKETFKKYTNKNKDYGAKNGYNLYTKID